MRHLFLVLFSTMTFLFSEENGPKFMPEGTSHPIVSAVKIVGMIATAIFVVVMVYRSIRVVKEDEDDKVHLPD